MFPWSGWCAGVALVTDGVLGISCKLLTAGINSVGRLIISGRDLRSSG